MFKFKEKKPTYTVCKECGVHFEPVTGYEKRWGDWCKQHRGPIMERDRNNPIISQTNLPPHSPYDELGHSPYDDLGMR